MRRAPRRSPTTGSIVLGLVLAVSVGACGKKGPPLAPLRPRPSPVADLAARRIGSTVSLRFTIPATNVAPAGSSPASLDRLEVYAFTDDPSVARLMPLADRDVLKVATRVATIAVRPPPPPGTEQTTTEGQPAMAAPAPDPRPAQGEVVVVTESLDTVSREPVDRASLLGIRLPPPMPVPARVVPQPRGPPLPVQPLVRRYVVVGYSRHGDRGGFSARATIPFGEPPLAPPAPVLAHTKTAIQLTWTPPADAPAPVQRATTAATVPPVTPAAAAPPATTAPDTALVPLPSKSLAAAPAPYRYNVYAVEGPDGVPGPVPLNPAPLVAPAWEQPGIAYGQQRCYVVRALRSYGDLGVEGAASPAGCVTPADTFPPSPPANLTAVATEGAISLIWDRSTDTDVAGYLVLRGEAPGETLVELSAEPINTTTYRDTTVRPGVRYVYAIVAVDRATPPNRSDPSNRVEESAR